MKAVINREGKNQVRGMDSGVGEGLLPTRSGRASDGDIWAETLVEQGVSYELLGVFLTEGQQLQRPWGELRGVLREQQGATEGEGG